MTTFTLKVNVIYMPLISSAMERQKNTFQNCFSDNLINITLVPQKTKRLSLNYKKYCLFSFWVIIYDFILLLFRDNLKFAQSLLIQPGYPNHIFFNSKLSFSPCKTKSCIHFILLHFFLQIKSLNIKGITFCDYLVLNGINISEPHCRAWRLFCFF